MSYPPEKAKQLIADLIYTQLNILKQIRILNMELIESSFIKKGFLSDGLADYSVTGKKNMLFISMTQ